MIIRFMRVLLAPFFIIYVGIPIFWLLDIPYWIITERRMKNDFYDFMVKD